MATHNELGKAGEQEAVQHLVSNGYKIRHTNWRAGNCELDIVAEKDNMLIVAEVKTRSYDHFGRPEDFVNKTKMKRTIFAANQYVHRHNIDMDTRFDIISVLKSPEGYKVEHIEDAFMPSW